MVFIKAGVEWRIHHDRASNDRICEEGSTSSTLDSKHKKKNNNVMAARYSFRARCFWYDSGRAQGLQGSVTPGVISENSLKAEQVFRRVHRVFSPIYCPTAMPCWWGLTRPKQLSIAATAWVIWLCACVRYWPDRELVFECVACFYCSLGESSFQTSRVWLRKLRARPR